MDGESEGLSRRRLLQLGAGAVLGLAAPAIIGSRDASAVPLRANRTPRRLTAPNLDWNQAGLRCVAGVRPHRDGGVRLGLDTTGLGRAGQNIIHNYGHGGGGITLSLGCALRVGNAVARIVGPASRTVTPPAVAIIGSGVAGLTVARELKNRWPRMRIRILTRSQNITDSTSHIAGGQFAPSGVYAEYNTASEREFFSELLLDSRRQLQAIVAAGQGARYGIRQRFNYSAKDLPDMQRFVPKVFKPPIRGELPFATLSREPGWEYDTWLIEPPIFLEALRRELVGKGVAFRWGYRVAGAQALRALPETIVINCSGLGAGQMLQDADMVPIKGHLVILRNRANLKYLLSGCASASNASYFFGRTNDMVVGGTYNYWDDSTNAETATCQAILRRMQSIFDGDASSCR